MDLKLGVFGFLPTTHVETDTNKMRPRSSLTVRPFTHVYLQAKTAVYTHLTNYGYFNHGKKKPEYPQFAGIEMAQASGSPLYICDSISPLVEIVIYLQMVCPVGFLAVFNSKIDVCWNLKIVVNSLIH